MLIRGVKLRKAVGSIVALLFIVSALVLAFVVIQHNLVSQEKLREIQRKRAEALSEKISLTKAVPGIWNYDSVESTLTINITNNYHEPVEIIGITIYYNDKTYDIIKNSFSSYVISAEIVDGTSISISSLPVWVPSGATLKIVVNTRNREPSSVNYAVASSIAVAGVSASRYLPLANISGVSVANYELKLTPIPMGEGTSTVLGKSFTYIADVSANITSVTVIKGTDASGNEASLESNDDNYFNIKGVVSVSDWTFPGWARRIQINITENSGETLTNYPIRIDLGSSFSWNFVKSDGSDIRFSLGDGTELAYWIEEWNYGSNAKIWVKIPSLPASSTITIYMYYNNSKALSPNYTYEDVFTFIGEAGVISTDENDIKVNLSGTYSEPPIVFASLNTFNDGDTVVSRITERTATYFKIRLEEYPSDDGDHENETLGWIALKPGIWVIGSRVWEVGTASVNYRWKWVYFDYDFSSIPAVLTYINSYNEGGPSGGSNAGAHTRQKSTSAIRFRVKIEEEGDYYHTYETVGYLAMETGAGITFSDLKYEVAMVNDVMYVRNFNGQGTDDTFNIYYWNTYEFTESFGTTPVVVFKITTENDRGNCHERLNNVTQTGFDYALQETPRYDGVHFIEEGAFIAIEPGLIYGYKYVDPAPTYTMGSEEIRKYESVIEINYNNIGSNVAMLNVQVTLKINVSANVAVDIWNYDTGGWERIISENYVNVNNEMNYSNGLLAQSYVEAGSARLRLNITSTVGEHIASIDEAMIYGVRGVAGDETLIYISTGGLNEFYKYNPETDRWSALEQAPITFSLSTPLTYDGDRGFIWVIHSTGLYAYIIFLDSWIRYDSSISVTLGAGSSMFYLNNSLYIIAGGGTSNFYKYNIMSGNLEALASIPVSVGNYSVAELLTLNGVSYIYLVVGGTNSMYRYNILSNSWELISNNVPNPYPVGFAFDNDNNKLWLLGKGGGLYYFNVNTNEWYSFTPPPYTPEAQGNRMEYYNGKLYHVRNNNTREMWIIVVR